jgi:putative ABC transport system ATP-binding protein
MTPSTSPQVLAPAPGPATLPDEKPVVSLRGVSKTYRAAQGEQAAVSALHALDMDVGAGEFIAVVGRSGCGKSTLLNILGGLDTADAGQVLVAGRDLSQLNEAGLTIYRREAVGIVFQSFNLLPLLSVLENAALPALMANKPRPDSMARAATLLERVGLGHRLGHQAAMLSGGEMQRVSIARALINEPAVVLADEPTGNLDSQSAEGVLDLLQSVALEGRTVIMVTHSREAAALSQRTLQMRDGRFE